MPKRQGERWFQRAGREDGTGLRRRKREWGRRGVAMNKRHGINRKSEEERCRAGELGAAAAT